MDIENLRLLIEVARQGSFAAVARSRDTEPSSVSRAIAALEDELGVRLLQRTTRRMSLTEAGEQYLSRIEPLVNDLDRAHEEVRSTSATPTGTLRLTASVAFGQTCLGPLLPQFRQSFPQLKLELLLTDANLDLVCERVDLAIRLGPKTAADVTYVKLFDTRYRVCASPAYRAGAKLLREPDDLRAHRCLLSTLPDFRSRWLFRNSDGIVSEVSVDGDLVISNPLTLRDCAVAGLGPALLANWLVDKDIAEGRLVELFPEYRVSATNLETAAWLLYPSRAYLPHKVRVAVEFLKLNLG